MLFEPSQSIEYRTLARIGIAGKGDGEVVSLRIGAHAPEFISAVCGAAVAG